MGIIFDTDTDPETDKLEQWRFPRIRDSELGRREYSIKGMIMHDIPVSNRLPVRSGSNWFLVALFIPFLFVMISAHFLFVAKIANAMGDPTEFPEWLVVIDRFFVYHIHSFVSFIAITLWLLVVAFAGFLVFGVVFLPFSLLGKIFGGEDASQTILNSFREAGKFMFLPITISLITLAIIPSEALNKPSYDTILKQGESMQFVEFVDYLSKASYFVFMGVLLIVVFLGVVGLMIRFLPENKGCWQLPFAVVISLAVSIGAAIGLFALIHPIQDRASGYSSLLGMLSLYSVISIVIVSAKKIKFLRTPPKEGLARNPSSKSEYR